MLIPYTKLGLHLHFTVSARNEAPQFGKRSSIGSPDGIKPSDAATLMSDSVLEGQEEPVRISDHTFDDWVRQHQRLLFGIAYWWTRSRTDAEELTQEAFFQAYRSRSSLREIEAVKGWLVRNRNPSPLTNQNVLFFTIASCDGEPLSVTCA